MSLLKSLLKYLMALQENLHSRIFFQRIVNFPIYKYSKLINKKL